MGYTFKSPSARRLQKVMEQVSARRNSQLSVPERHQLKIARGSMRMHCVGVSIMGGPNHYQAADIIERLSGAIVGIDADCTCSS